jgi:sigma-E factor negative regulatory protein RseC
MQELGWVREIAGEEATVVFPRRSECDRCKVCTMGVTYGDTVELRARNVAGAAVGSQVTVEVGASLLGVSMVVYVVPLLLMFAGYFAGDWVATALLGAGAGQPAGIVASFLGIVLGFFYIASYDRRLRQSDQRGPRVVSIVQ